MQAKVSIIMGSLSDYPVMEKAANFLNDLEIPFDMHALSAHRTPEKVEAFAKNLQTNGVEVVIAAAGMAAHLPGVIAALTSIPVIGVPIKSSFDGLDALLAIVQMPPGIPVATVAVNGSLNSAILAAQILGIKYDNIKEKVIAHKKAQKEKIEIADKDLEAFEFKYRVN